MARYAIINGTDVLNVVVADKPEDIATEHEVVEATRDAEPGGTYQRGEFTRAPQPERTPSAEERLAKLEADIAEAESFEDLKTRTRESDTTRER